MLVKRLVCSVVDFEKVGAPIVELLFQRIVGRVHDGRLCNDGVFDVVDALHGLCVFVVWLAGSVHSLAHFFQAPRGQEGFVALAKKQVFDEPERRVAWRHVVEPQARQAHGVEQLLGVQQVVVFGLGFFAGIDVGDAPSCQVYVNVYEPGLLVGFVGTEPCVEVFAARTLGEQVVETVLLRSDGVAQRVDRAVAARTHRADSLCLADCSFAANWQLAANWAAPACPLFHCLDY